MKIEYYIKNVYGNELMYIADKEIAESVAALTNSKTLLPRHMDALEKLGCKFEFVHAPVLKERYT